VGRNAVKLGSSAPKIVSTFPGAPMFLIFGERLFCGQLCREVEASSMFSLCQLHYRASWSSIWGLLGPL